MADSSDVAVVGAGVVGSAVALALARRGAAVIQLEAESGPGLAASGTNSGVLHAGFDSPPGEPETELILRSAAPRDEVLETLGIPVLRSGALLRPLGEEDRAAVAELAANARRNGVEATLGEDGSLKVPGEAVTDPIAYTEALAAAAQRHGADLRTGFRVAAIAKEGAGLRIGSEAGIGTEDGAEVRCRVAVNCAGLYADSVAALAGDHSFEIYPRKGEFLVFDPPEERLERILLPVPTKRTKGVLVFPTIDGKVIAGPTAVDGEDKSDWSVRPGAAEEIIPKAVRMYPPLEGAEPIAAYAGLRPAGRGVNYVIGPSKECPELVNVAAIRSTGLTASLGIAARVAEIVAEQGIELGSEAPLEPGRLIASEADSPRHRGDSGDYQIDSERYRVDSEGYRTPWWRRVAEHRGVT